MQRTVAIALLVEGISTGYEHVMHIVVRELQTRRVEEHGVLELRMTLTLQNRVGSGLDIRQLEFIWRVSTPGANWFF